MKRDDRPLPFYLWLMLLFSSAVLGPAEISSAADDAIVLEESQIFGKAPNESRSESEPADLPALSTAIPWEGEEPNAFNIPEEILTDLTQPDSSHLSGEAVEQEGEEVKGE